MSNNANLIVRWLLEADEGEITVLNGALIRWGPDLWAWKTGEREPRVKDLKPSFYYNFRIRTYGSSEYSAKPNQYIEVPIKLAQTEPELSWVNGYPIGDSGDDTGDKLRTLSGQMVHKSAREGGKAIRKVYLVPLEEWDDWNAKTSIGAHWDKADEEAILQKANQIGSL